MLSVGGPVSDLLVFDSIAKENAMYGSVEDCYRPITLLKYYNYSPPGNLPPALEKIPFVARNEIGDLHIDQSGEYMQTAELGDPSTYRRNPSSNPHSMSSLDGSLDESPLHDENSDPVRRSH